MTGSKKTGTLVFLSLMICLIHVLPFYILVSSSFKSVQDLSSKWRLPDYLYLDNFSNAWKEAHLGQAFFNNIVITVLAIVILVGIGSISAYPLARYKSRLNRFVFALFLSALIVPPLTTLVPLYRFMVEIRGMNEIWGIVVLHVTFQLPITIFLYTGFIDTIPKELDEAALIDGAGRLRLFFSVILPLLKPITATVVILSGVAVWNDYNLSVFFLQEPVRRTITVALSAFFGQYNNNIGWVAAGSLMGAIPITVVYLFLQRYFISGLSSGAVKG